MLVFLAIGAAYGIGAKTITSALYHSEEFTRALGSAILDHCLGDWAMAKTIGLSPSSVQRIWRAHKLQPHRLRTFKRSRDPGFAAKLTDIVGLYVDPPAHALVLSLDEKSQIQALDRTQPGLPIKPGRCQTMTHDYKRHGTTTLFAALSVLDGTVIGRCMQRHRHSEFIRFLNAVEREVPAGKLIHTVLDNYATHKHPKVLAWLSRHPRWTFHFTPTSASWLNAVENFFSKMTRQRIRRGVFRSIADLQTASQRLSRRPQYQCQTVRLDPIRRRYPSQPVPSRFHLQQHSDDHRREHGRRPGARQSRNHPIDAGIYYGHRVRRLADRRGDPEMGAACADLRATLHETRGRS